MTVRRIAVLGAGHGGTAAAADLTLRGFEVRLQARRAERIAAIEANGGITVRGVHDGLARIAHLTTDIADAVDGADLIMLVVPSVAHEGYARLLAPLLDADTPVFLNPGHTGGGLHFAHALAEAGFEGTPRLCETVTLTYISRLEGAAAVAIHDTTKRLMFAALPARETAALYDLVKPLYPEITPAGTVLETGMSNMNAVFHPPGMLMNAGWIEHTGGAFLFYREGITEAVGRVVSALDAERVEIASGIGVATRSFLETFHAAGLTTDAALASGSVARACRESEPNRTLTSPPSLDHRYVHEDVGHGLVPMAAFAGLAGVKCPVIDAHIDLLSAAAGIDYRARGLTLERMGLDGVSLGDVVGYVTDGR